MSWPLVRPLPYPAIDGLRFYAAFVVFLVHLVGTIATEILRIPEASFNPGSEDWKVRGLYLLADGNHGVDVFFLISGFLMGRVVLTSPRFSYVNFITKRFIRIYPAFIVSLICSVLYLCNVIGWRFDSQSVLKNMIFLNAIKDYDVVRYNHVTWSLGYEFAFYFVLPMILLLGRFLKPAIAASLLFGVAAVSLEEYIRALALFAGTWIAAFSDSQLRAVARRIPLSIALIVYATPLMLKGGTTLFPSFASFFLFFLPAAVTLFIKLVFDEHWLSRILIASPTRLLGTVSYSFYLFHTLVITAVLHSALVPLGFWGHPLLIPLLILGSFFGSLLVATASYVLFEQFYFAVFRNRVGVGSTAVSAPPAPAVGL